MSSGSWHAGANPYNTGPFAAHKTWVGGSDRKKIAQLPYSMDHYRIQIKPSRYNNKWYPYVPPYFEEYSPRTGGALPDTSKFPAVSSNVSIDALNAAAEAIRGHDFNAAVAGAELKQSVEQIMRSAYAFKKLIAACFALDAQGIARALGNVAGNKLPEQVLKPLRVRDIGGVVLAMRYGWLPLLQDTYEAMKALEEWRKSPSRQITFRGRAKEMVRTDIRHVGSGQQAPVYVWCKNTVVYTIVMRERVSLTKSLGLTDPASVVWEKIPFSFLWDWWLPVGDYLSATGFFSGLDLSYSKTTLQQIAYDGIKMYPSGTWPPNVTDPWVVNGSYKGAQTRMRREVGTSINVPLPSWKELSKVFSPVHLQNAGALILALFQYTDYPFRMKRATGKPRKPRDSKYWSQDRYAKN